MELENKIIMILELPKAIKCDLRQLWRIYFPIKWLLTKTKQSYFLAIDRKEPMAIHWPEKHLSFKERKKWQ